MLSNILTELRKMNNTTQHEIADLLEITQADYNRYEAGSRKPPANTLDKLAKYFNVSTDFLSGRTNDPTPIRNLEEDLIGDNLDEEIRQILNDPEMRVSLSDYSSWSDEDKRALINHLKTTQMVKDSKEKK